MKIAIITTLWRRKDLTKIVLDYYKDFNDKFILICAGSEGEESKELADGWHYIEVSNNPLSEKHNALLTKAKELNVDGVVLIGSDDLLSKEILKFYHTLTPNENEVVGFKDCYFYLTEKMELWYFKGHRFKQTIGAGRFFSKQILDKANWRLWNLEANRGLDTICTNHLKKLGINERVINLKDIDGFMVDIKHTRNITPFAGIEHNSILTKNVMAKKLSKKVVEAVEEIIENKPKAVELEDNKMYNFVSNGKSVHLKKGETYVISGADAKIFLLKEYGFID
jgi:hypothetical protein